MLSLPSSRLVNYHPSLQTRPAFFLTAISLQLPPVYGKSDKLSALISQLSKKAEEGQGARFAELLYTDKLRKNLPPLRVIDGDWHAYEKGVWSSCTRSKFEPIALKICPKCHRKARHAQSLLDHLEMSSQVDSKSLIGFYCFFTEDDGSTSILINAANGIVKIWAGGEITLEKHHEQWGFTSQAAAVWSQEAKCDLFDEVCGQSLPDADDRNLLQLFCGNVLWPSAEREVALISYGQAGTSKSTIAEAIAYALMDPKSENHLVTNLSMPQICDSRSYSLPNLRFAALNLGTEVDTIDLDESTNFKQLVSGEPVEVRRIYGNPMSIRFTGKLWFLANILPRFKTGTDAELRRLRFIQHDVVPANKDTTLKTRLRAERDGIFRWMIDGLVKLQSSQAIPQGGAKSRKIVEKFAMSNDPVGWFVRRRCEMGRDHTVKKEWLLNAFKEFLGDYGLPVKFEGYFFRRLYERFSEVAPLKNRIGNGERENAVAGINLKKEFDDLPIL